MDINKLRADMDKERDGVWVPYKADVVLKIARLANPLFREAEQRIIDRMKQELHQKDLTNEQAVDARKQAAAETILLGWKNVTESGEPVEYSAAKALEWFRDPELWRLWTFVLYESTQEDHFLRDVVEDTAKN